MMVDTTTSAEIGTAIIYSLIAFSIVFIVLGGLTLVIFAMRLVTGSGAQDNGNSGSSAGAKAASAPAVPAKPASAPGTANAAAHHVAAITAAILAITKGRGRIKSVTLAGGQLQGPADPGGTTQRWRATGMLGTASRRLAPVWKR